MPGFRVTVTHELRVEIARERLRSFSDKVREAYAAQLSELREEWNEAGDLSFSFKVMGLAISGQVVSTQEIVEVEGTIPFAALPFRGQLENEIETKIREALDEES